MYTGPVRLSDMFLSICQFSWNVLQLPVRPFGYQESNETRSKICTKYWRPSSSVPFIPVRIKEGNQHRNEQPDGKYSLTLVSTASYLCSPGYCLASYLILPVERSPRLANADADSPGSITNQNDNENGKGAAFRGSGIFNDGIANVALTRVSPRQTTHSVSDYTADFTVNALPCAAGFRSRFTLFRCLWMRRSVYGQVY